MKLIKDIIEFPNLIYQNTTILLTSNELTKLLLYNELMTNESFVLSKQFL